MGDIPAVGNMVSTVIKNPKHNDVLAELTTFNIQLSVANMNLGSFTNATSTYYSAPQALQGGRIVGHTHVTIQNIGQNGFQFDTPLDAQRFAFFKGVNDNGDGNGNLVVPVTGGLPASFYRICTMAGASNHQPVMMPVAQRGAQDDCRYFEVSANGAGGGNGGNAGGNNGGNAGGNNGGNAGGNNGGNAGGNNGGNGQ